MDSVQCQKCFHLNPPGESACRRCSAPLGALNVVGTMPNDAFVGAKDTYTLTHRLGEGGMGEVWAASRSESAETVAVKILHPHLLKDERIRRRAEREADVMASLEHPNVVRLVERVQTETSFALALEYVDGGSLRDKLEQSGALSWKASVSIMQGVLEGLSAIHEAGIVHRDIKPANVLLDTSGGETVVKLVDFGIVSQEGGTAMTQDSSQLGTYEYMSPEQGQGAPATVQSDLYACGIMFYELLVGAVPFQGTLAQVVIGHATQPPDWSRLPSDAPSWFMAALESALQKTPEARHASAKAFALALRPPNWDSQLVEYIQERMQSEALSDDDVILGMGYKKRSKGKRRLNEYLEGVRPLGSHWERLAAGLRVPLKELLEATGNQHPLTIDAFIAQVMTDKGLSEQDVVSGMQYADSGKAARRLRAFREGNLPTGVQWARLASGLGVSKDDILDATGGKTRSKVGPTAKERRKQRKKDRQARETANVNHAVPQKDGGLGSHPLVRALFCFGVTWIAAAIYGSSVHWNPWAVYTTWILYICLIGVILILPIEIIDDYNYEALMLVTLFGGIPWTYYWSWFFTVLGVGDASFADLLLNFDLLYEGAFAFMEKSHFGDFGGLAEIFGPVVVFWALSLFD